MALDIQPLSPARHALMLVVLFGLLAASLGLAGVLVRRSRSAELQVESAPAPGFALAPVSPAAPREQRQKFTGQVQGRPRIFTLLVVPIGESDTGSLDELAQTAYLAYFNVEPSVGTQTVMAGLPALDLYPDFGTPPAFPWLRATIVGRDLLVATYTGKSPARGEDLLRFDEMANKSLKIRTGRKPRSSPRL